MGVERLGLGLRILLGEGWDLCLWFGTCNLGVFEVYGVEIGLGFKNYVLGLQVALWVPNSGFTQRLLCSSCSGSILHPLARNESEPDWPPGLGFRVEARELTRKSLKPCKVEPEAVPKGSKHLITRKS